MATKVFYKNWTIVAVTALPPGWRAAFKDSSGAVFTAPVPAVLIEECRETERWTDGSPTVVRSESEPYERRAVAAMFDGSDLIPVDDVNSLGVYGPGEEVPTE